MPLCGSPSTCSQPTWTSAISGACSRTYVAPPPCPTASRRLFAAVCVACRASARAAAWQLVRPRVHVAHPPRPPAAPQPKVLSIEHDDEAHPAAEWAKRDELLAAEEEAGRPRSDSGPAAGPEHDYTDGLHKHDSRFTFPGHEYGDHQKHLQHLAYQEHLQRVRDEA